MCIVDTLVNSIDNDGVERRYEYRVTKSSFISEDLKLGEVQCYGMEIERKDLVSGKVVNIERDAVKNISTYRHKVQALCNLMRDNLVSPINFIEIAGEYIDNCINDFDNINHNTSIV